MSPVVRVIHLPATALAALAEGDLARAERDSPVALSPWIGAEVNRSTWRRRARQVLESPEDLGWVTGVIWDEELRCTVGRAGFHGAPDTDARVEIGYAVDPDHRRRGYALAALRVLVDRARAHPDVAILRATVSPTNLASLATLAHVDLTPVGEQWDDEDGLETILEMSVGRGPGLSVSP